MGGIQPAGGVEMRVILRFSCALALAVLVAGCSLVPTIQENTGGIQQSSETIAQNTEAVGQTTETLASLEPSMNRLAELRGPMESLREPMIQVAALGPVMEEVSRL